MEGRTQVVAEVTYYSPNSNRCQDLVLDCLPDINPFRPGGPKHSRVRFWEVSRARPWTKLFGWLCFVPLDPRPRGFPFESLSMPLDIETLEHRHQRPALDDFPGPLQIRQLLLDQRLSQIPPDPPPTFRMAPKRKVLWRLLEDNLFKSVVALKNRYSIPMVLPFLPFGFGYCEEFAEVDRARSSIKDARDWFYVWVGALSFAVAFSVRRQEEVMGSECRQLPNWQVTLADAGLDPAWIDGVQYSLVCDFDIQIRRAGCVVDVDHPEQGQPPLSWFVRNGIPVWHRVASAPPLAPLSPHVPERSVPAPVCTPARPGGIGSAPLDRDSSASAQQNCEHEEPAWVAHFKSRESRHAAILLREMPAQRQTRENRTWEPPTSSAPVFEWWPSDTHPDVYERMPVRAASRADTLRMYRANQKRYDPFFNDWDCCAQFAVPGSDSEGAGPDLSFEGHPSLCEVIREDAYDIANAPDVNDCDSPSPLTTKVSLITLEFNDSIPFIEGVRPTSSRRQAPSLNEAASRTSHLEAEVQDVFGKNYGFLLPPPTASIPEHPPNEREKDLFLRLLGNGCDDPSNGYFDTHHFRAAQAFFNALSQRKLPPEGSWDIHDSAMLPLKLSASLSSLSRISVGDHSRQDIDAGRIDNVPHYYVYTLPRVSWRLALLTPEDALHVCRLSIEDEPEGVVFYLLQRGIPFRLLSKAPRIPRVVLRGKLCIQRPVRPFGHTFTVRDYESYVNLRTLILSQPHMQAALRRGGIVWRLAIPVLGLNDIMKLATQCRSYIHLNVDTSNESWVDDSLTKDELDLICGVYECISDDGRQRALKSWWPQALYYEKDECGENYGRWCHRRELWFTERLRTIESGEEPLNQPFTYTEWKSKQHGVRAIRTFRKEVHASARHFLDGRI